MSERMAARLALGEEHGAHENQHDPEGIMKTFRDARRYDGEPGDDHHTGRDGVGGFYGELLRAVPDLHIDVRQRHVTLDTVVLEVMVSGLHLGAWRGLPPTGRAIEFPLCGIFTFDDNDRLA